MSASATSSDNEALAAAIARVQAYAVEIGHEIDLIACSLSCGRRDPPPEEQIVCLHCERFTVRPDGTMIRVGLQ